MVIPMSNINSVIRYAARKARTLSRYGHYYRIHRAFRAYTMSSPHFYLINLALAEQFKLVPGAVVECGVWRGGMIAGLVTVLGKDREYFLFDSFEGLPPAQPIDGDSIKRWQEDKLSPWYYDNCKTDESYARKAMGLAGARTVHIVKGWFKDTVQHFPKDRSIAVLRLDGDLFESTLDCLNDLYASVVKGGLIIFDDYYVWEGCSRAVHHFLSQHNLTEKVRMFNNAVCYIRKESDNIVI